MTAGMKMSYQFRHTQNTKPQDKKPSPRTAEKFIMAART